MCAGEASKSAERQKAGVRGWGEDYEGVLCHGWRENAPFCFANDFCVKALNYNHSWTKYQAC